MSRKKRRRGGERDSLELRGSAAANSAISWGRNSNKMTGDAPHLRGRGRKRRGKGGSPLNRMSFRKTTKKREGEGTSPMTPGRAALSRLCTER